MSQTHRRRADPKRKRIGSAVFSYDDTFAEPFLYKDENRLTDRRDANTYKEIYPEAVRENALAMLEPTFLQGEQIGKWCNGAAEDKALIPNGYVGDPKGSQYIETNLKEADRRIAMDIVNRKPASSDAMFRLVPKEKLHRSKKIKTVYFLAFKSYN